MNAARSSSAAVRLHTRYTQLAQQASWVDNAGQPLGTELSADTTPLSFAQDHLSLAVDPARGPKILDSGIEEAAVALHALRRGVLQGVTREASGHSEFADSSGTHWDVKSPISPPRGQAWVFDVNHHVELVREEMAGGEGVLLNLSRCNATDARELRAALAEHLGAWSGQKLYILSPQGARAG